MRNHLNIWKSFLTSLIAVAFSVGQTFALGVSGDELRRYGMPDNLINHAKAVSAAEGVWTSDNGKNCYGAFQFCSNTLKRYYDGTPQQFMSDPAAQVAAWVRYQKDEWKTAQRNGVTNLIGQRLCYDGKCATITESSILFACQFGCGKNGKIDRLTQHGDCNARNVKDGNSKSVCDYLIRGAGNDVGGLTDGRATANPGAGAGSVANNQMVSGDCFLRSPWSEAGARVMSPYGVMRSSRTGASNGYHQGLDIINSAGRGDPLYAAQNAKIWQMTNGSGGLRIITEAGDQRVIWMHVDRFDPGIRQGSDVTRDTKIGEMGATGTINNATVHHHLGMLMRGSKVQSLGGGSRVWSTGDGQFVGTKNRAPLTSEGIKAAAPEQWYFVDPEPFLYKQLPYRDGLRAQYNLDRDTTAPNDCAVAVGAMAYSSNGGSSLDQSSTSFVGGATSTDYALDAIENSDRAFMLDLARQGSSNAQLIARGGQAGRAENDLALGLMIINELE